MIKKFIGYIFVFIGFICFLIVGGGSMRNRSIPMYNAINESFIIILLYILIPIVGFFLIRIGFKIISNNK